MSMVNSHINIATNFGTEIKNKISARMIAPNPNQRHIEVSGLFNKIWFGCVQYIRALPSKTKKNAINFKMYTLQL